MSKRSVDIEAHYLKPIHVGVAFSDTTAPSGPSATVESIKLAENPNTSRKVEYVVSDNSFKAQGAMNYLYKKKTGERTITQLLSAGLLGVKRERKLVPTRWAITAVDDSLGKQLIRKIKQFPLIDAPVLFRGNYLDNFFWILIFPRPWSYELLELWHPRSVWSQGSAVSVGHDFEDYFGRKTYASDTQGAYYAARLTVLEYLEKIKKQASVLVVREILPDYWAPLGVWVIREAVRGAFKNKGTVVEKKQSLVQQIERELKAKRTKWQDNSQLLKQICAQRCLNDF